MLATLTDEQEALRARARALIERELPLARVRELADTSLGDSTAYRAAAGAAGWYSPLADDPARVLDAAVIAAERGRLLQPGPFAATTAVVGALASAGSPWARETVLPSLIAGRSSATWAVAGSAAQWNPTSGVNARTSGGGVVLDGTKHLVHDAHSADWLLVSAVDGAGGTAVLVERGTPGLTVTPFDGLDLTRTLCHVSLDGVEVPGAAVLGERGRADELMERALQVTLALTIAEAVGAMDEILGRAVTYAGERVAFGRPIGSFQAVKHLLADASRVLETAKAVAVAAARSVDGAAADAPEVVSMAKSFVGRATADVAHAAWQTFGGVAYTWEHDFHLYLRRLTADAALYGDAAWHNERICALHGL